ncbi:hypothetical protein BDN67DRAFT_1014465 [Paxillus ammoniavirescens]|nr:hypothetical protein BDN67DRAFT_1014465 [Paxillus ammoniavirescens]
MNFTRSLDPTPLEYKRQMFAIAWHDPDTTARFCIGMNMYQLTFRDPSTFWCFKHTMHRCDQTDWDFAQYLEVRILMDAFLEFNLPEEVPLGVQLSLDVLLDTPGHSVPGPSLNTSMHQSSLPTPIIMITSTVSAPSPTFTNFTVPPTPHIWPVDAIIQENSNLQSLAATHSLRIAHLALALLRAKRR